ncbi:MAG: hypothetical protein V1755_05690 [Chloroflexota bacterium]
MSRRYRLTDRLPDYMLDEPEDAGEEQDEGECYYCGEGLDEGDHRRCNQIGEDDHAT